jgi:hypothetical protein
MSKTLKRPMFRMGGDTNSGIMSGFKREKFQLGTNGNQSVPGGESVNIQDVPSQIAFPRVTVDESQSLADLITAAKRSGEATSVSQLPTMSQRQQALQDVQDIFGDVPPELKRGFGLSEYLALVKLGANIASAPNQGKGFKNFVRSASKPIAEFAEDIGELDRAKTAGRLSFEGQKKEQLLEAGRKGQELDFTAQLQAEQLLTEREIKAAQAAVDYAGDLLNVNDVQYILTNSLLLDQIIKGNPPDSDEAKLAIERKKELNKDKKNYKAELEVAMKKPGALNTDLDYLNLKDVPAAEKPSPYTGLDGDAFKEAYIQEQLKGLDVDEIVIPKYDPNYKVPESTAKWFEAGGMPEQIDVKRLFGFAEGGRVGFQQGGTRAGGDITGMAPGMTGTTEGTASPISFEELRARLPQEVSNEVVRLLASSEAALIDFAQIQTQDDISRFNQKYNTDLQLPAQQAV